MNRKQSATSARDANDSQTLKAQQEAKAVTDRTDLTNNDTELMREYVADLLNRLGGKRCSEPTLERTAGDKSGSKIKFDRDCLLRRSAPVELTPGPRPPECVKLHALRALANSEARAAIAAHCRIRQLNRARHSGAIGLSCLLGVLLTFICVPTIGLTLGIAMTAGLIGSAYHLGAALASVCSLSFDSREFK